MHTVTYPTICLSTRAWRAFINILSAASSRSNSAVRRRRNVRAHSAQAAPGSSAAPLPIDRHHAPPVTRLPRSANGRVNELNASGVSVHGHGLVGRPVQLYTRTLARLIYFRTVQRARRARAGLSSRPRRIASHES
jgi:hypothetical protein